MNYLYYSSVTPLTFSQHIITTNSCGWNNTVFNYFAFGKLSENPVVTPSTSVQVITPSALNKYLQSVTVNAIPVTP
jgi:hypothetical protein